MLVNDLLHCGDHIFDICLSHPRINREGDDSLKNGAGIREVLRLVPESVAVIRVEVQWDEMD